MDASYEQRGPIPYFRMEMSIFYIVYFIVFPFFFVNIFVALIIITFQEQGEAELEEGGIDKNQVWKKWIIGKTYFFLIIADWNCKNDEILFFMQKSCIDFAINARPFATYIPPMHKHFKYKVWSMVESKTFDYFIMLLIVLNTILLMMKVNLWLTQPLFTLNQF